MRSASLPCWPSVSAFVHPSCPLRQLPRGRGWPGRPRARAMLVRRPGAPMPERRRPPRSWAAAGSTGRRQPPAAARAGTEVDVEPVNCALAPGDWRAERRLGEVADLARFWKTAEFHFAEDEAIVERDFEASLTP